MQNKEYPGFYDLIFVLYRTLLPSLVSTSGLQQPGTVGKSKGSGLKLSSDPDSAIDLAVWSCASYLTSLGLSLFVKQSCWKDQNNTVYFTLYIECPAKGPAQSKGHSK